MKREKNDYPYEFLPGMIFGIFYVAFLVVLEIIGETLHFINGLRDQILLVVLLVFFGFFGWKIFSKFWNGYKEAESKKQYLWEILCVGIAVIAFVIILGVYFYYRKYALGIAAVAPVIISLLKHGVSTARLVGCGIGLVVIFGYLYSAPDMTSGASGLRAFLEIVVMLLWWGMNLAEIKNEQQELGETGQPDKEDVKEAESNEESPVLMSENASDGGDDKRKCPNCGEEVKEGEKFCGGCGTKLM